MEDFFFIEMIERQLYSNRQKLTAKIDGSFPVHNTFGAKLRKGKGEFLKGRNDVINFPFQKPQGSFSEEYGKLKPFFVRLILWRTTHPHRGHKFSRTWNGIRIR